MLFFYSNLLITLLYFLFVIIPLKVIFKELVRTNKFSCINFISSDSLSIILIGTIKIFETERNNSNSSLKGIQIVITHNL
jgi:hypothetical protein